MRRKRPEMADGLPWRIFRYLINCGYAQPDNRTRLDRQRIRADLETGRLEFCRGLGKRTLDVIREWINNERTI